MPDFPLCRSPGCAHSVNWHGARAGTEPGACLHPRCTCPTWTPAPDETPPGPPTLADPIDDVGLFAAYNRSLHVAIDMRNPDAGYRLMMEAIRNWARMSIFHLPPIPPGEQDRAER